MVVGAAKIFSIIDWAGLALSDALALILVFNSSISSDFVISRYLLFYPLVLNDAKEPCCDEHGAEFPSMKVLANLTLCLAL